MNKMMFRFATYLGLALLSGAAQAAFRNVDDPNPGARQTSTGNQSPVHDDLHADRVEGVWGCTVVDHEGKAIVPKNRAGRFDQLNLEALQSIAITLTPAVPVPGGSVYAYTVNGGRIDGKIATALNPDKFGNVSFTFTAGKYFGNYPVVLRYAGREEVLNFWVQQADLTPRQGEAQR